MLIGQFWGTGAAEGVPAPFCRCDVCEEARAKGGRYIRRRSCFRVSDELMIDLGADAVCQSMLFGEISKVNHVLVTHTHDDHLNPHMLMEAMWSKLWREPLHYYFTDRAFEMVEHWRNNPWILKGQLCEWEEQGLVVFHQLEYGKRYTIGEIDVIPLRGNHKGNVGENTALYLLFLPNGKTLFYGLDSGSYFPETLEALAQCHVDDFVAESAYGLGNSLYKIDNQHQSFDELRILADRLVAQGTLDQNSRFIISHVNHNNGNSYDALVQKIEELQFPVPAMMAYDGLKIY